MIELIGIVGGVLAVAGVISNAHQKIGCFYLWIVSNSISMGLHIYAAMASDAPTWALAGRDAIFLALAFYGLKCWRKNK